MSVTVDDILSLPLIFPRQCIFNENAGKLHITAAYDLIYNASLMYIIRKKYQVFSPAAELLLERLKKEL